MKTAKKDKKDEDEGRDQIRRDTRFPLVTAELCLVQIHEGPSRPMDLSQVCEISLD